MLSDKIILITGGCGTIGSALVEHILMNYSPKIIRIYSRDETKQHLLSKQLNKYNKKLRFFIGDVRDKERLNRAMENVNIVFHLAALKHVIACEYNPFEAIKTNILGLQNLIEISIDKNVERVIFTSTDKAATPCNTMGVTKLLGEKLITAANYYKGKADTIFYSVRFGNVIGSRGSLIPLIENQVKKDCLIIITSDHGESFYEHGLFGHQGTVYDEVLKVPLIITEIGKKAKKSQISNSVQLIDIAPTILDYFGIEIPETFQGTSLLPLIRGKSFKQKKIVISECYQKKGLMKRNKHTGFILLAIRKQEWKYIFDEEKKTEFLFNIDEDPQEKNNLIEKNFEKLAEFHVIRDYHLNKTNRLFEETSKIVKAIDRNKLI
ncbi:hypothetical protein LCGC14_2056200 [marine sediment metagenome]|uniref:Polysaccharide biosynthesis protein CapD-like domain-containing protein n=1 Tax=marine sediment metagenome TaxID=412755 RepID=A0A0F9HJK3_9ZZZZ